MRDLLFFILLISSNMAQAQKQDPSLAHFLLEFHQTPEQARGLDRDLLKKQKPDPAFLEEKMKFRENLIRRSLPFLQPLVGMKEEDRPEVLADGIAPLLNIKELDRLGVSSRSIDHLHWSDTYWPTANGLIAARYTEPSFPHNKNWLDNHASFVNNPPLSIATDHLSPAEKYDLLMGDSSWSMTNYSWRDGENKQREFGRVPAWMGLCHGWSAANQMQYPIPYDSVTLISASGRPIRFYQSDMKALITMMWAKTDLPTRFIGFRCEKTAPRDGKGRILDPKCFDTNPASLYLTVVNQIGLHNRGFVMDATAEGEVWNYPVIGYKSIYFNPQSLHQTDNINQAIASVDRFTIDKFKSHRALGTAYVVGVAMDLTHLNETNPSHGIQINPATLTKRYVYDLELDSNFNVIGGEWYTRSHPDFLWAFSRDSKPLSPEDTTLNGQDWDVSRPIPASWTRAAQSASAKGLPLYTVIERILETVPTSPR